MIEHDDEREQDAGILRRWSRRKRVVAGSDDQDLPGTSLEQPPGSPEDAANPRDPTNPGDPGTEPLNDSESSSSRQISAAQTNAESAEENAEPLLTDEDMPAIESISKDSDLSCFFNRGVSEQLRQRALSRLLRLPAFNITDGLNDYDEDYTVFEPLGDIVTSDMRFHARRKEKLAAQQKKEEQEALAAKEEALEAESQDPESQDPEQNPQQDLAESDEQQQEAALESDSEFDSVDDSSDAQTPHVRRQQQSESTEIPRQLAADDALPVRNVANDNEPNDIVPGKNKPGDPV